MASSRTSVRQTVVYLAIGLGALATSRNAHAQDELALVPSNLPAARPIIGQTLKPADVDLAVQTSRVARDRPIFLPLYSSFIALQALDLHSTMVAINSGWGCEANPVMNSMLGGAGFPIVKAAGTAATIYLTERMRKHHRGAAIVTMIALDSAYAAIVAHNYAIGRR